MSVVLNSLCRERFWRESHGRLLLSDENRRMDRGGRKSELERIAFHTSTMQIVSAPFHRQPISMRGVLVLAATQKCSRRCPTQKASSGAAQSSFSRGPQRACTWVHRYGTSMSEYRMACSAQKYPDQNLQCSVCLDATELCLSLHSDSGALYRIRYPIQHCLVGPLPGMCVMSLV